MNRRLLFFILINTFSINSFSNIIADSTKITNSPDITKFWSFETVTKLIFNQISLTNWAKGGESSLSGKSDLIFEAKYKKENISFENDINLDFGLMGFKGDNDKIKVQKTEDKIDLSSVFGYEAYKNWYVTTVFNFKTQFANGFKYPDDSTLISDFFSPAYFTLSFGFDYKPSKKFSLFMSPAAGKLILVLNQELADKGAYGVIPAEYDTLGIKIKKGKKRKAEFGINIICKAKDEIFKNITGETKLVLYNNYLDDNLNNRWNIDIDWETKFELKVNKHISTNLYFHSIYDHNVPIPEYEIIDDKKTKISEGPKLQIKESFGLGFTFRF
ncbi:MAG: DUF3078 domain-containing protein [Bacteroidales bacterium]|nr:DUF3078 domain-containing protein [Bacteroidales bacterium]